MEKKQKEELQWRLDVKGIENLTDRELVRYIVQSGTRYNSLDDITGRVLSVMDKNAIVTVDMLEAIPGVGEAKAQMIAAALEIGRRRNVRKRRKILTPDDVYQEVRHYATREQEHLIVVALNGAHEILFTEVATVGLVNMTLCHPREVFSNALQQRATGIILVHNHPSGVCDEASQEDIAITKRIKEAGAILGVNLIDHIIISENGFMSFKAKGML